MRQTLIFLALTTFQVTQISVALAQNSSAAADHAREQSVATSFSQISHTGKNGSSPTDRGNRYGSSTGVWENIGAGPSPEYIVMNLMLDYWEVSRGHREAFLNSNLRLIGVGCGNSSIGGVGKVCVMNFAQEYSDKRGNLPNQFPNQTDRPPRNTNQPRQLNLTGEWVIETGSFKFLSNDVNNSCVPAPELGTGRSPITRSKHTIYNEEILMSNFRLSHPQIIFVNPPPP